MKHRVPLLRIVLLPICTVALFNADLLKYSFTGIQIPHLQTASASASPPMTQSLKREAAEIKDLKSQVTRIQRARGRQSIQSAEALHKLGRKLMRLRRNEEALKIYQEILDITRALYGPNHYSTAAAMQGLAQVYASLGQFYEAEPLYKQSLAVMKSRLGANHAHVGVGLLSLGNLYKSLGNKRRAIEFYNEAYRLFRAGYGAKSLEAALVLNNLGNIYLSLGQYDDAEKLLRESLRIRQSILKPNHHKIAVAMTSLAGLLLARERFDEAAQLYQRVAEIERRNYGEDHLATVTAFYNLGVVTLDQGRVDEAEALFNRCLGILQRRGIDNWPRLADILRKLAFIHAHRSQWQESADLIERAFRIQHRHLTRVLPGLPQQAQLKFLPNQDRVSKIALSLGARRPNDPELVHRTATWMLNRKGLGHQALAENALLSRDKNDPAQAKLIQQINTVRARMAQLLHNPPTPVTNAWRTEVRQLDDLEQNLSKRLARSTGRIPRKESWVDAEEVRNSLSVDSVLIDIARYQRVDFSSHGKQALFHHYAAIIIPPTKTANIQLVDLGPSDTIEAAIDEVRLSLEETMEIFDKAAALSNRKEQRQYLQSALAKNEHRVNSALGTVARLVLTPLLPYSKKASNWIVSPDHALWLVPWSALPLPDSRFVAEEYRINYVVSGRDLIVRHPDYQITAPLLVADPDYALSLAKVQRQEQQLGVSQKRGRREPIKRLPNTAREAKQIQPLLARWAQKEPALYLGDSAVERVVKAARNPQVMVLSTHGFFERLPRDWQPSGHPLENPFLRSGLLFAGADHRGDLTGVAAEDGMLTGLEIVGTDLRGTELVVLSACQTGLGDVRLGESVAGLRQAFQLAGAQAVIATLWSVPDRQSADLMIAFFQNIAAGQTMAAAMRSAQIMLIAKERESGRRHPYFWAAYTLTGAVHSNNK